MFTVSAIHRLITLTSLTDSLLKSLFLDTIYFFIHFSGLVVNVSFSVTKARVAKLSGVVVLVKCVLWNDDVIKSWSVVVQFNMYEHLLFIVI